MPLPGCGASFTRFGMPWAGRAADLTRFGMPLPGCWAISPALRCLRASWQATDPLYDAFAHPGRPLTRFSMPLAVRATGLTRFRMPLPGCGADITRFAMPWAGLWLRYHQLGDTFAKHSLVS